ncbi:hypothetical protein Hypma_006604 [Hypsizygus marmoreus]|uniref:Putative gamma-glutamylcyclotransferase n=1 Tax=Hypsizygus marmoreus TaxID=39966 RepID=A0A369K4J0_HYPMA|nr:hypothetical protein Hypma_006604 [Hypsizygus marmoreus]
MAMSAFFYGTLMHPKVLKRVIKNDGSHLEICPAVLLDYTRHKVKNAEYPGVIPYAEGRLLCRRELDVEEKSVRGTLVIGLTERDIQFLDYFEGSEYTREGIDVHPLDSLVNLNEYDKDDESLIPSKPPALPTPEELATPVKAEAYVYKYFTRLEAELWSFEEFVKKDAQKWYGPQKEDGDVRWA